MNRIPLIGKNEFRTAEKTVLNLELQPVCGYEPHCIEYSASGTFKGKSVQGVVYEYFPDDVPGMYYDILRNDDKSIAVGYLSVKPFENGKNDFRTCYSQVRELLGGNSEYVHVVNDNNTCYAYVDSRVYVKIGTDYKKDLLSLVSGASALNDKNIKFGGGLLVRSSSGDIIPCGAYEGHNEDENVTDENIYSFGKIIFNYLFGREPETADRRFFSDWDMPSSVHKADVDILKNILRSTLQITRRNCFSDFKKIKTELSKLK